jgi:hypothetical protein
LQQVQGRGVARQSDGVALVGHEQQLVLLGQDPLSG